MFSGAGGLTAGMHQAGFETIAAVETNSHANTTYKLNFQNTCIINKDIRSVKGREIRRLLKGRPLHLLAGCPPCQGFSSIRRLNGKNVRDDRNSLILEYLRLVRELKPLTIMLENVPGLKNYYLFNSVIKGLQVLGYHLDYEIVNVKDYGVPQNRRRFVLVGSLLGKISIAKCKKKKVTVRNAIGSLTSIHTTRDPLHKIICKVGKKMEERIAITPKDGGSWRDLPKKYFLKCHLEKEIGFNDVYGRLKWDEFSATITGGCLNPSKGRFLHPDENRSISAREAALLQSFPKNYIFPLNIPKDSLALLIGNALPPKFSYIQSRNIRRHLETLLPR